MSTTEAASTVVEEDDCQGQAKLIKTLEVRNGALNLHLFCGLFILMTNCIDLS